MSDNKRACESENGVSENPIKKAKIDVENCEKSSEIKRVSEEDNGKTNLDNGDNVNTDESEKKTEENGHSEVTNGVGDEKKEDEPVQETDSNEEVEKSDESEKKTEDNGHSEVTNGVEESEKKEEPVKEPEVEPEAKVEVEEKKKAPGELTGELLFCGGSNWDLAGRRKLPKDGKNIGPNLWTPHRVESMKGAQIRFISSGPNSAHSVIINDKGEAFTWGRNECGQLGHGDLKRRETPLKLDCLDGINIVSAACGRNHTLLLSDSGRVFAMGDNKCGQLGLGNNTPMIPSPTQLMVSGPPVCRVAAGGEFSMIADIKGNLFSFGTPEYGQLGHNTDGKYFITSSKQTFNYETSPRKVTVFIEKTRDGRVNMVPDVEVKEIACGTNHTVIVDQKRRVFSWGFGGYGRLGHACPKDEMVPRLIKQLEFKKIAAIGGGNTYTVAHSDDGIMYFWGQTKSSGEATMYPKPVNDLSGWKVRSLGVSQRSIVVAADESVVSWGPSPTSGELGLGDHRKSSTTPTEVKSLNNVYIHRVACGMSHTLFLARNDTQEDRDNIEKLPVFKGM